jgi:hypothetical protein
MEIKPLISLLGYTDGEIIKNVKTNSIHLRRGHRGRRTCGILRNDELKVC